MVNIQVHILLPPIHSLLLELLKCLQELLQTHHFLILLILLIFNLQLHHQLLIQTQTLPLILIPLHFQLQLQFHPFQILRILLGMKILIQELVQFPSFFFFFFFKKKKNTLIYDSKFVLCSE